MQEKWETWLQSLGGEDALEKGQATHSSILAWRVPMDRGAWWATVHGVAQSQTRLSGSAQHSTPTPVLSPGEVHAVCIIADRLRSPE